MKDKTQENQELELNKKKKGSTELPSSGLVNALACEARVAEKTTTTRHKHRYCLAIFLFLENQTRNSWCFPENFHSEIVQVYRKHEDIYNTLTCFPDKIKNFNPRQPSK